MVGPPNTGKTFFSMLMAGQTPYSESYQATVGLRVQVGQHRCRAPPHREKGPHP